MERFSDESRKPDPTNPSMDRFLVTKNIHARGSWVWLTKSCLHWSLASETTGEAVTSTKTIWRLVLKNSYYANVRIVTVLICLLLRLFRIEREVLGPFSFGSASAFYTSLFTSSTLTLGTA